MAFDTRFLSSRVARRIFLLFIVCALVPITALAVVSFYQVSAQLYEHGEQQLENDVRGIGQGIAERLLLLEAELVFAQRRYPGRAAAPLPDRVNPLASRRFLGLTRLRGNGQETLYGEPFELPPFGPEQGAHLDSGSTLLLTEARAGQPPAVFLALAADDRAGTREMIVAAVDPAYLWGGGSVPRNNELCVFDPQSAPLFCTRPEGEAFSGSVLTAISNNASGTLEWNHRSDGFLAAYWSVPLAYQFGVPRWTVMLSVSKVDLLAPMASFRRIFPFVVLLSLWLVLLLSVGQIRRSLDPLDQLRRGTRKIGAGEFDSRVDVSSNDEFEELADSFNEMASRLGKQFNALETIAEIDHTILSSLDIETIVRAVLRRSRDLFDCRALNVMLVSSDRHEQLRIHGLRPGATESSPWIESTLADRGDLAGFDMSADFLEFGPDSRSPEFLTPLSRAGCERFIVFPMLIHDELAGAISFGFAAELTVDEHDLRQARQLADQVTVALSNARLVDDLAALNWGTLTALARTVDAKSTWTAGHSERVAAMGVKLGRVMGLSNDEIDTLQRGGLLHDIGKIGIPTAIIDNPGRLTREEYDLMKMHPEIGAKILRPIAAYADVIPIVLQHHERWDGSGYPGGLVGDQIHPYARIFAVADVYDAMISDRPYRSALPLEQVIETIVAGDGTQFEPEVVAAFLEVVAAEDNPDSERQAAIGAR